MKSRPLVALVVVLGACGKSEPAAEKTPTPQVAVALDAAPPTDASMGPAIERPFELPTAHTLVPLPQTPAAYIFVTSSGAMRVGPTPSFAAATEVADVPALLGKIPVAPDPPDPGPQGGADSFGHVSGYGFGVGAGGSYVAHTFSGERSAPSAAHVVLVADRGASLSRIGTLVNPRIGRLAVAAVDEHGTTGALPVVLWVASAPAQYQIRIASMGADVVNLKDGSSTKVTPGSNGMLDPAALRQNLDALYASASGKDARVGLHLTTRAIVSDLVAGLDAAAGGTQRIGVTVRAANSGMRGRGPDVPQVRIGQPAATGDLDKAIIRRYIKRNIQKIAYCYEKQLLVKSGLEGTVTTEFVIKPDGTVASSKASGVHEDVSRCVAEVIHKIEFPKPKGGGIVQVRYPFTFRPTGG